MLNTRPEFRYIANAIPQGARVLDLGCGDGSLLRYLRQERGVTGYGVEIDDANVVRSLENGIDVLQKDLESGLSLFTDASFDVVILSQTIQAIRDVEGLLQEMLRVGKQGIVTFPNFGHWPNRLQILAGKMPVSDILPYQWFDTPNIHLCTVNDFAALLARLSCVELERVVLHRGEPVTWLPNSRGSLALFRFAHR